jgi:hypothetical protein
MNYKNKVLLSLMFIVIAISLSACGPTAAAEPTVDPAVIMTDAVATSMQRLTMEAIMNPSETPIPTDTPVPTNTPEPTMTATTVVMATLPGVDPVNTAASQPTLNTGASVAQTTAITAKWIAQTPEDYTKMYIQHYDSISPIFDIYWKVQNTGTVTWNDKYYLEFFLGDKFFRDVTQFNFPTDCSVAPEETIDLKIVASRPYTAGTYTAWWKVKDPEGNNIGDLSITIVVVDDYPPSSDYPY